MISRCHEFKKKITWSVYESQMTMTLITENQYDDCKVTKIIINVAMQDNAAEGE